MKPRTRAPHRRIARWLLVLTTFFLVAAGALLYRGQQRDYRSRVEQELVAIGRLKVDQIAAWRDDQLTDAALVASNPFLIRELEGFLGSGADGESLEELRPFLEQVRDEHDYSDILIAGVDGSVRFSLEQAARLPREYTAPLVSALERRQRVFVDLHAGPDGLPAQIAVVAPLLRGGQDPPIGAVVFVNDASRFLYPLIQSWPIPSESAETYLVRREGDHALVLNELRHRSGTALSLRLALDGDGAPTPAAQAAAGRTGVVHGRSYRGDEIVSALLPVPDSPWLLVAEIAQEEAFAAWRRRSRLLLVSVFGWAATLGAVALLARQRWRQRHRHLVSESEQRHRDLLMRAPDAIFVQTRGRFAFANEACARLLGADRPESLVGQPVLDRIHPDFRDQVRERIRRLNEERQAVEPVEEQVVDLEGRAVWVEISAVPLRYEGDHGALVFMRDIRARRAADDALRAQREMLERTERIARIGSWEWEVDTDAITWSEELYRMLGLDPAQPTPSFEGLAAHFPPAEMERLRAAVDETLATGEAFEIELDAVRADGEIRQCISRGFVERDPRSGAVRLAGSFQDVTERKQAEAARERLMTAIEQSDEAVVITDVQGSIEYANPAFERITGYSLEEVRGRNPSLLKSGRHDDAFYHELWTTISSGKTWHGRVVNRRKDGSLFTEEMTISPVRDPRGAIVNYVAAKRDVSEEIRLENELHQMQKLESIGRLAGGVAHDFNNMLSVIGGYAELALERLEPEAPLRDDITEILAAAERAASVTRQLLGFARRQAIAPEVLDLNDTVERMLKMLRPLIGEEIDIAWSPAPSVWPVLLDRSQVSQILANLCTNARDAISGPGKITIETGNTIFDEAYCAEHPGFRPGEYAMLSVSDDGSGMDPETMSSVFEPFFTAKDGGTGLGLATVYGIVRQNQGFINVYSEPGEGSAFRLYFPRHQGTPIEPVARDRSGVRRGRGETILLVEDDDLVRRLALQLLGSLGYSVLEAATPDEAIELAESYSDGIDLLLTDVVMPGMNGRELARRLRSRVGGDVRLLFMSGYSASVISHRGVLEEGVHFIQKPFSMEDLASKVREALGDVE